MSACAATKQLPPKGWTPLNEKIDAVFSPTTRELNASALPGAWKASRSAADGPDLGATHSIGSPIQVYPLLENGFRAYRGQSIRDNHAESAKLYADFAKIAETNEYAWSSGKAERAESIATVSKSNRMICFPCPWTPYGYYGSAANAASRSAADERFQQRQSCCRMHSDVYRIRQATGHTRSSLGVPSWWCGHKG